MSSIAPSLVENESLFGIIPGDVVRKISKLVASNAKELTVLQRINKHFYNELEYNMPYMNILWESITRITFGDEIPNKLRAKKWNKIYQHYYGKHAENTDDVMIEMDINKIEIDKPATHGLPQGFQWDFPCDLEFEDMQSTGCDDIKFCNKCAKHVYEIELNDRNRLNEAIKDGVCVAITKRKGYQINGVWYERKPLPHINRKKKKSQWRYNGRTWIRI